MCHGIHVAIRGQGGVSWLFLSCVLQKAGSQAWQQEPLTHPGVLQPLWGFHFHLAFGGFWCSRDLHFYATVVGLFLFHHVCDWEMAL